MICRNLFSMVATKTLRTCNNDHKFYFYKIGVQCAEYRQKATEIDNKPSVYKDYPCQKDVDLLLH